MTGVPESSWTRIRPCETASQMYSKCIVEPLISTPIAMTASKGCLFAAPALSPAGVEVPPVPSPSTRERRLVVLISELAPEACVLPPSMSLLLAYGPALPAAKCVLLPHMNISRRSLARSGDPVKRGAPHSPPLRSLRCLRCRRQLRLETHFWHANGSS